MLKTLAHTSFDNRTTGRMNPSKNRYLMSYVNSNRNCQYQKIINNYVLFLLQLLSVIKSKMV